MKDNETVLITSSQNAQIKFARSLDKKKDRYFHNAFRAEGGRHIKEGLDLKWKLLSLFVSPEVQDRPHVKEIIQIARVQDARISVVSSRLLETITNRENAQNAVGIFVQKWAELDDFINEKTIVALERPKDPGNLGTIMRTIDATNCRSLILLEESCDPYSTEAIRAAMGSSFAVKIAKANITNFLKWQTANGFLLYGTHVKSTRLHTETEFSAKSILLMGNEQSGIDDELANACDALVKLPMAGRADSLNLAIATGICLYEIWRQSGFQGRKS
ncbi:MAG: RNA methyltransferase [Pseudomonadota bacterium]